MIETTTTTTTAAALPPNKRVNYTYGMILGVDEFRQEQQHFEWKHQLGNRLLHGYGTVCGLHVSQRPPEPAGTDIEIVVERGYAISPQGHWIWVDRTLCARLDEWVQQHKEDQPAFDTPGQHTVYVQLCYEECLTDLVPVAGQPCASDEDSRAPSRILESFHAALTWQKPAQTAESYYRLLEQLLRQIELVTADSSPPAADDAHYLLDCIRAIGHDASPPANCWAAGEVIRLNTETAGATLQEALLIWTTEVCPRLAPAAEDCVLLACVQFEVNAAGRVLPDSVTVDNCERPFLLPGRLQQALLALWPDTLPTVAAPPDEPDEPDGDLGDDEFVIAPAGHYINVGAGVFAADGTPHSPPYHGLEASLLEGNQYLLFFPDYKPPSDEVGYMVEGTLFGTPSPATTFQVIEFNDEGILVCIKRPVIRGDQITFELVAHPFMVEISRYKPEQRQFRRRINVNTATIEELRTLPRIGPALANRIADERQENGPFATVQELTRVSGIGPWLLEDIRPFIFARS